MDTLLSIPLEAHSHQTDLSPPIDVDTIDPMDSTIDSIASSIDPQPIIPVEPISVPPIPQTQLVVAPEEEEEERSTAGPYCICRGADDGTPMICCDQCNEWYHCRCIRMSVKVAKTLNEFYCFKCKPEAAYNSPMVHLEDYTVIDKKSPSPYATRSGGRRTQLIPFGSELFQPGSSDEESASSSSDEEISKRKTKPKQITRTTSNSNVRVRENKEKRKLARQEDPVAKKAKMSSDNDPKRLQIRKLIFEPLSQEKDFDQKVISEIAADIERELYKLFDLNTYKAKIRTLLFNFKDPKNTELRKSILTKELPADVLAKMNSTDLANKELAQYRRKRDEKHTAELVIKDEPKPAVMLLRGDRWASEGFDALTSSVVDITPKPEELEPSASVVIEDKSESKSESTTVEEHHHDEPEQQQQQPVEEEEEEVQLEINTEILNSAPIEIPAFNDFDDTPREEPVKEAPKVPGQVWAGYIKTTQLFRVRAIKVGSATIKQKHFPETLVQCGRMEMGQLFNYLPQLEFSTSRKLDIVVFEAISEDEEEDYASAFESLKASNRAAVVKTNHFKESFIFPLPANSAVPEWAEGYTADKDRLLGAFISARSSSDRKKQRDIRRKQNEKVVEEEYNPMFPSTSPVAPPPVVAATQNPILASLGVPQVPLTMLGTNPLLGNFMMPPNQQSYIQPPMTAPPIMMGQPQMTSHASPMLPPKVNAPPPMMHHPMAPPPTMMNNPMMGMTAPMLDMGLLQQLSSMLGTQPQPPPNNTANMNASRTLSDPRRMRNM